MQLFQQTAECPESGPVRCEACRAYMNPFVTWLGGGRRFQCNLCGETSDVPGEYACGLGVNGRRLDAEQRPELTRGTVEYQATSQYLVHLLELPIRPNHCTPLVHAKSLRNISYTYQALIAAHQVHGMWGCTDTHAHFLALSHDGSNVYKAPVVCNSICQHQHPWSMSGCLNTVLVPWPLVNTYGFGLQ